MMRVSSKGPIFEKLGRLEGGKCRDECDGGGGGEEGASKGRGRGGGGGERRGVEDGEE